jgi:hypothetical protein
MPPVVIRLKKSLFLRRLFLYDDNNYFVTPTDGAALSRGLFIVRVSGASAGIHDIVIRLESSEQRRATRRMLFPLFFRELRVNYGGNLSSSYKLRVFSRSFKSKQRRAILNTRISHTRMY